MRASSPHSLDLDLLDNTKDWTNQNRHFFQQPQFLAKFFLRRIPCKNLKIDKGRVEMAKKIKMRSQMCIFLQEMVKSFEKEYKIKVVDC